MPSEEEIAENLGKGHLNPVIKGKDKKAKKNQEIPISKMTSSYDTTTSIGSKEEESDEYVKGIKEALNSSVENLEEKFKKIFVARFCIDPKVEKDLKLKSILERSHNLTTNEWMVLTQKHFNAYGGNIAQL